MKLIKSKGLIIGKQKFQLIGANKKISKPINLKGRKNVKLHYDSRNAIKVGLQKSSWVYRGREADIHDYWTKPHHSNFIKLLQDNPKKKKEVLIVGPANGYEATFIKEKIPGRKCLNKTRH